MIDVATEYEQFRVESAGFRRHAYSDGHDMGLQGAPVCHPVSEIPTRGRGPFKPCCAWDRLPGNIDSLVGMPASGGPRGAAAVSRRFVVRTSPPV